MIPVTYSGALALNGYCGTTNYVYLWHGTNFDKSAGDPSNAPTPNQPKHFVVYNGVLYFNAQDADANEFLFSLRASAATGPALVNTGVDARVPLGLAGETLLTSALALVIIRRKRARD